MNKCSSFSEFTQKHDVSFLLFGSNMNISKPCQPPSTLFPHNYVITLTLHPSRPLPSPVEGHGGTELASLLCISRPTDCTKACVWPHHTTPDCLSPACDSSKRSQDALNLSYKYLHACDKFLQIGSLIFKLFYKDIYVIAGVQGCVCEYLLFFKRLSCGIGTTRELTAGPHL